MPMSWFGVHKNNEVKNTHNGGNGGMIFTDAACWYAFRPRAITIWHVAMFKWAFQAPHKPLTEPLLPIYHISFLMFLNVSPSPHC